MAGRERTPSRSLDASFHSRVPDRLSRLVLSNPFARRGKGGRSLGGSRPLGSSFDPRLPDLLRGLSSDSSHPGRRSLGERARERWTELLLVTGLRLFVIALFAHLVTSEVIALTAFNLAIALPVVGLWLYHRYGPDHGLGEMPRSRRLCNWLGFRAQRFQERAARNKLRRQRFALAQRR